MSALTLELPYNYDNTDLNIWLTNRRLELIKGKNNTFSHVQRGDGIKAANGMVARVVETLSNEVGEPFIVIANNKLDRSEMYETFDQLVEY